MSFVVLLLIIWCLGVRDWCSVVVVRGVVFNRGFCVVSFVVVFLLFSFFVVVARCASCVVYCLAFVCYLSFLVV